MKKIWLGFWRFVWRSLLFVLGVVIVLTNIMDTIDIFKGTFPCRDCVLAYQVGQVGTYLFTSWLGYILIKYSISSTFFGTGRVATKPEPDKADKKAKK